MNKFCSLVLILFLIGCHNPEDDIKWEKGWDKDRINMFNQRCNEYGSRFYDMSPKTIAENCNCITNALSKTFKFRSIEGLYIMFSQIAITQDLSPNSVIEGFSNVTSKSRGEDFIRELRECCSCHSGLCYDAVLSAELVGPESEYAMKNNLKWEELESELPKWCLLDRKLSYSYYFYRFHEATSVRDLILPSEGNEISMNKENITEILISESGDVLFRGFLEKKYIDQSNLYQLTSLVENELASNEKMTFSIEVEPKTNYADYIKVLDYVKLGKATKIQIAD